VSGDGLQPQARLNVRSRTGSRAFVRALAADRQKSFRENVWSAAALRQAQCDGI